MIKIYNDEAEKITDDANTWETSCDDQQILYTMGDKIYDGGPKSGLRELVANSARAQIEAIENGITPSKDAEIKITISEDRLLTIEDNGIGISRDVFENALLVLGNSTNFNRSLPGKFGMGFASHTTLTGTLILDTMYVENGVRKTLVAIARDCREFKEMDAAASQRTRPGTTLKLMLYDEEGDSGYNPPRNVKLQDLYDMIERIGLMTPVRLSVDVAGTGDNPDWTHNGVRIFEPRGVAGIADDWRAPDCSVLHVRNDDIEMAARIKSSGGSRSAAYLLGMPVDSKVKAPFDFVMNIRDEGRFEPSPHRESMLEAADIALQKIVDACLVEYASKVSEIKDHATFKSSGAGHYLLWMMKNDKKSITKRVYNMINPSVFRNRIGTTLSLANALSMSDRVYYMPMPEHMKRVAVPKGAVLLTPAPGNEKLAASIIRRWGIPRLSPKPAKGKRSRPGTSA